MHVDLEDSYQRIHAARTQVELLAQDVVNYLDTNPLDLQTSKDEFGRLVHLEVKVVSTAPAQLWLTASDVMHKLRAGLDNAVHAIAVTAGGSEDDRRRQFPIELKSQAYWGKKGKPGSRDERLRGVPEAYRRVIDEAQPFNWGRGAERSAFRLLAEFSNVDKHRQAHRAFPLLFGLGVDFRVDGVSTERQYFPYEGDLVVRDKFAVDLNAESTISAQLAGVKVGVGFGSQGWQVGDFARAAALVDDVLRRLATVY